MLIRGEVLNNNVGDITQNVKNIIAAYQKANVENVDILVVGELVVSGYPCDDLLLQEGFLDACESGVNEIVKETKDTILVFGAPTQEKFSKVGIDSLERNIYNSAIVCQNGEIVAVGHKMLLPTYSVFDDSRHFVSGKSATFDCNGVNIGVLICEDLWNKEPARLLKEQNVELILGMNASVFEMGKQTKREKIIKQRSTETDIPIVYVNVLGGQDELVFDGGAFAVDTNSVLGKVENFNLTAFDITFDNNEIKQGNVVEEISVETQTWNAMVLGLRDYVNKNGFANQSPSVLLGLSGGVDSALVLKCAVDAVGENAVTAVMLTSRYTSEESVKDAQMCAEVNNVKLLTFDISTQVDELLTTVGLALNDISVAAQNAQARVRADVLMTLANMHNCLLLSTSNRSETAVGYFTLYGDSCGVVPNPIGDLYKTSTTVGGVVRPGVFAMCDWLNVEAKKTGGKLPIPLNVLNKPPSAELAPDQKDADSLPEYNLLDKLLVAHLEQLGNVATLTKIAAAENCEDAAKVARKVISLVKRSEFKRRQCPPRVKLGPVSFGRDRRVPVTNGWSYD